MPLRPSLKLQDSLQESGFLSLFFGGVATASAAVSGDRNVVLEQLFHELQVLLVERVFTDQLKGHATSCARRVRVSKIGKFCKFLAGSFSAVSKPNFARKYAFVLISKLR